MDNAVHIDNTDKPNSAGFLIGLLFGALAGFGTMILLAPQSGKRTRIQIEEKSIALQNRATDTYDDLVALSHFDNRKILTGEHMMDKLKTDNLVRSAHV